MIELRGVSKRYGNTVAVREVSLRVDRQERLIVSGHSGCGKTTLLRLIAGLEVPDAGEVYLNGRPASCTSHIVPPHRRGIGMVFQDLALWPHMSVREHIAFGLDHVYRRKSQRDGETAQMLRMLHLDEKAQAYPGQLSGGEQQRVALGRALVRRPGILLLDEPLAHLDCALREEMIHLMAELFARYSMTTVYVTHGPDVVRQLAGRHVEMRQGRVARRVAR